MFIVFCPLWFSPHISAVLWSWGPHFPPVCLHFLINFDLYWLSQESLILSEMSLALLGPCVIGRQEFGSLPWFCYSGTKVGMSVLKIRSFRPGLCRPLGVLKPQHKIQYCFLECFIHHQCKAVFSILKYSYPGAPSLSQTYMESNPGSTT